MKYISFSLVFCCLLFTACVNEENDYGNNLIPDVNSYTEIIFNDDFDNPLDTQKWEFAAEKFWNYDEIQEFVPENSIIADGNFQIHVYKDIINEDSVHYSSSSRKIAIPKNTGRLDIRFKFPTEKGILSAISLRNRDQEFPDYTGIDVAVARGLGDGKYGVSFVSRFEGNDGLERGFGDGFISEKGDGDDFHQVTLIKEQDAIFWFFDGKLVYKCYKNSLKPHEYPFNNPMDLYINVSVDGYWAGAVDVRTKFPQILEVDHIRCYKELSVNPNDKLNPLPKFADYNKLEWGMDFNEDKLNKNEWNYKLGDYWYNGEKQAYTSDTTNSFIRGNKLVIKAMETPEHIKSMRDYTSARLTTRYKKDIHFGRLDVMAKLPETKGMWPAIWIMATEEKFGPWPFSGEIDMMEQHGHDLDKFYTSVHYSGNDSIEIHKKKTDFVTVPWKSLNDEFHLYSLILEKDQVCWYLDGKLVMNFAKTDLVNGTYPFNEKFYLLLNLAVGGGWPGYPNETTVFPQEMVVDYVRYYTRG